MKTIEQKRSELTALVVSHLKTMGVDASHEHQDTIHIERDAQWCWVFGTINEQWDGNLCCDGDPQQSVILPFQSDDVEVDPHEIAELIAYATTEGEAGFREFEIDGSAWSGTTAEFIGSNHLAQPDEIIKALHLTIGQSCDIGGGAAATVNVKRVGSDPLGALTAAPEIERRQEDDGFCSVAVSNSDSLVATVWGADTREVSRRATVLINACNERAALRQLVHDLTEHLKEARNEQVTEHKLAMLDGGIAEELIERGEAAIK